MVKMIAAVLLAFLALPRANTQEVFVSSGYMRGQDYVEMSLGEKRHYAMGVVNGMLLAPLFGAPKSETKWLEDCIIGMNAVQLEAILTKYLRDNPGKWHQRLHAQMYFALKPSCPGAPNK